MDKERRDKKPAIPADVASILTQPQKVATKQLLSFGWKLEFVRRPLFQEPTVVVRNPDNGQYAVVNGEGVVDHNPAGFQLRNNQN